MGLFRPGFSRPSLPSSTRSYLSGRRLIVWISTWPSHAVHHHSPSPPGVERRPVIYGIYRLEPRSANNYVESWLRVRSIFLFQAYQKPVGRCNGRMCPINCEDPPQPEHTTVARILFGQTSQWKARRGSLSYDQRFDGALGGLRARTRHTSNLLTMKRFRSNDQSALARQKDSWTSWLRQGDAPATASWNGDLRAVPARHRSTRPAGFGRCDQTDMKMTACSEILQVHPQWMLPAVHHLDVYTDARGRPAASSNIPLAKELWGGLISWLSVVSLLVRMGDYRRTGLRVVLVGRRGYPVLQQELDVWTHSTTGRNDSHRRRHTASPRSSCRGAFDLISLASSLDGHGHCGRRKRAVRESVKSKRAGMHSRCAGHSY